MKSYYRCQSCKQIRVVEHRGDDKPPREFCRGRKQGGHARAYMQLLGNGNKGRRGIKRVNMEAAQYHHHRSVLRSEGLSINMTDRHFSRMRTIDVEKGHADCLQCSQVIPADARYCNQQLKFESGETRWIQVCKGCAKQLRPDIIRLALERANAKAGSGA